MAAHRARHATVALKLTVGIIALIQTGQRAPAADGARIVAVNRAAQIETTAGVIEARVGEAVPAGATIRTQARNTATIATSDGATLEVEQQTRVTFESFASGAEGVSVRLIDGTIRLAAQRAHETLRLFSVRTALAQIAFRARIGYITASSAENVVTCVRCDRRDRKQCEANDFVVSDLASCVSLTDAAVATVSRQHGIQTQSSAQEAMVQTVVGQLGGAVAAGDGAHWWQAAHHGEDLAVDRHALVFERVGDTATLQAKGEPDSGNVWALSADRSTATVESANPKGTYEIRAAGAGSTAVVVYDQLGRYAAVPVTVSQAAER